MESRAREWIKADESAKEMLSRVLIHFVLPPPLHTFPFRPGNVVEVVGPTPSAKTHILMQAAIRCILPKEWNGVCYGGLDHVVMFIDLDCRFDILHFSRLLEHQIRIAQGLKFNEEMGKNEADSAKYILKKDSLGGNVKSLTSMCLRRFFYVRCYNSLQFLATLKTMHMQIQERKENHGIGVHVLMIDRKGLSLQAVSEIVVEEIRKLLKLHRVLILTTKTVNLQDRFLTHEIKSAPSKVFSEDTSCSRATRSKPQNIPYREYMPFVWQNFVTHRVLIRPSDDEIQNPPIFSSEWLLPLLNTIERFTAGDHGTLTVPSRCIGKN
ncbi:DNA repair protein XRCC2 homolog isoform X2 [Apium graveolens]|uniref:DNA repair protein XRCC2 homolog isoform X2 n=1 Tax=Apium graveolens TaxID=4045 RepID=UPI003D79B66A